MRLTESYTFKITKIKQSLSKEHLNLWMMNKPAPSLLTQVFIIDQEDYEKLTYKQKDLVKMAKNKRRLVKEFKRTPYSKQDLETAYDTIVEWIGVDAEDTNAAIRMTIRYKMMLVIQSAQSNNTTLQQAAQKVCKHERELQLWKQLQQYISQQDLHVDLQLSQQGVNIYVFYNEIKKAYSAKGNHLGNLLQECLDVLQNQE